MAKKSYNKAELQKKAVDVFKNYTDADTLFATSDGQFFLNENRARLHAGAKGTVVEIHNEFQETEDKQDGVKTSAADLIESAKTTETVQLAQEALDAEVKGKNRKTVIEAFEARIEELKAADDKSDENKDNNDKTDE